MYQLSLPDKTMFKKANFKAFGKYMNKYLLLKLINVNLS